MLNFCSFFNVMRILLVVVILSVNCFSQDLSTAEKPIIIDISGFYDSAHHWYDVIDEERIISPLTDQNKYNPVEITKIADNILLFQKDNGGWAKNYDMLAILTEEQINAVKKDKHTLNTTFDNGATHSQVIYLATVCSITKEEKYKLAFLRGIDFILSAQYPNGGFPQFYPDTSGYRKYITFNDGAMIGVMNALYEIIKDSVDYTYIGSSRFNKVKNAFNKGIECILNTQIVDNGLLTAWCQQHNNVDYSPQWARTFEPPSICNMESAEIVLFLMKLKNPDAKIKNAIEKAVQWFSDSKITGVRYQTVQSSDTSFQYHKTSNDRIIIDDPSAPPVWARYYELGTHKPLFCNRDGKPVYSLAEVDRERRTGYAWYTYNPQEVLDKYPAWLEKWGTKME